LGGSTTSSLVWLAERQWWYLSPLPYHKLVHLEEVSSKYYLCIKLNNDGIE